MILIVLLCLLSRVLSEMAMRHVYVSKKSRAEPFETGYVYNQVLSGPGLQSPKTFASYDSVISSRSIDSGSSSEPTLETYSNINSNIPPNLKYTFPINFTKKLHMPKRDLDSIIAKSESKYNTGFLPSKIKTDAMYEQLKTTMHYHPPPDESMHGYETEYHADDDDIRTSSRGMYDTWPYYYHNPYEYERMKIDAEIEKAKDKRYAVDAAKIIPIHEDLSDDIPDTMYTTNYYKEITTDNPISGHDPFFSYMLKDYLNKNNDYEDHLTFKGLDWDKDFDDQMIARDIEDVATRNRRLLSSYNVQDNNSIPDRNKYHEQNELKTVNNKLSDDSEFATKQDYDKHEKGDAEKSNDKTRYQQNGLQNMKFKDFLDTFANKFGSEDHKKDSKYVVNKNQDKGENRKGFRRVYHKDEYQEDNEFYDNNNNSAKSEDKGSSNAHIGGSEALLKSHASAKLGEQANEHEKSGNKENNKLEKYQKGYDKSNGLNSQIHEYRDIAKDAARSNHYDYFKR